jgi:hypothetical protein
MLPFVLYGCETWCLTLRDESKFRVFVNRVLRKLHGPKRDEVTGGWRKLLNDELHNFYCFSGCIGIMKSEDGGTMSLRNIYVYVQVHRALQPTRPTSANFFHSSTSTIE